MAKQLPITKSKFINLKPNNLAALAALMLAVILPCCTGGKSEPAVNRQSDSATETPRSARFFVEDCKLLLAAARKADSLVLSEPDYNERSAMLAISAFSAYAGFCHHDSLSPVYLIKTAQVAKAAGRKQVAKEALDNCLENYPSSIERPAALFLLAQLFDEPGPMQNLSQAEKLYRTIISEHPRSVWSEQANGALFMLGKSDEEIIKELKKKNRK